MPLDHTPRPGPPGDAVSDPRRAAVATTFACRECNGEGRRFWCRGANDPYPLDDGPCPYCDDGAARCDHCDDASATEECHTAGRVALVCAACGELERETERQAAGLTMPVLAGGV